MGQRLSAGILTFICSFLGTGFFFTFLYADCLKAILCDANYPGRGIRREIKFEQIALLTGCSGQLQGLGLAVNVQ